MNHAQNLQKSYICEYVFDLLFPKKAATENFMKQLEYFQTIFDAVVSYA